MWRVLTSQSNHFHGKRFGHIYLGEDADRKFDFGNISGGGTARKIPLGERRGTRHSSLGRGTVNFIAKIFVVVDVS